MYLWVLLLSIFFLDFSALAREIERIFLSPSIESV